MPDHTPTQPQTKTISLTQGKFAIVDAADYEWLTQWEWYAAKKRNAWYAVRNAPRGNGTYARLGMHNALLGKGVDHIDGNGLNNTRHNLRLATSQQNTFNMKPQVGGTSAFKGVHWRKRNKKWCAQIVINGKNIHIGYFDDEEYAARAYDDKARELFGEFARLNFPNLR